MPTTTSWRMRARGLQAERLRLLGRHPEDRRRRRREICDELPAVWMPPSTHGLELRERLRACSRGCPGPRRRRCVLPVGLPSSPSTGASIGRISRLKRPSSRARLALLLRARARSASHVLARDAAVLRDALGRARTGRASSPTASRRSGRSRGRASRWRRGRRGSSPRRRTRCRRRSAGLDERARSGGWPAGPSRTACRPWCRRRCSSCRAMSQALRAMLFDCSPACVTQPPMICSTSAGSMPARSTTASCTFASRWRGVERARARP